MGSLIVALRRMRETGGSVVLHVTRPELLRALSESGLDRVFKIVAQPESTPPKGKGTPTRTGGARRIAGGLA
jgi:anti-anti-sigma regulatory factor